MLPVIINLIAIIFGLIHSFSPSKRHLSIVIVYFILSNCFYTSGSIVSENTPIKAYDFCIVYTILLYITHRNEIKINLKNKYECFLLLFMLFHLFVFFMTIILEREYLGYAIKVGRMFLIFFIYFPLKIFTPIDIRKSFKTILIIELIYGITFFLQYAGIHILTSGDELKEVGNGLYRFTNIPLFFLFFLIYMVITEEKIKYKYLLIIYLGAMLVLPMSRMRILFFCITISYYFIFLKKEYGKMLKIGIIATLIGFALSPYLLARIEGDSNNVSMKDDIMFALNNQNYAMYNTTDAGTLGFRISMLKERIDYMSKHPEYALTGVGFLHELSPNCYKQFHFFLGTWNENYPNSKGELSSVDIQWVQILMQMGYLGVILYLNYIFLVCYLLYKQRHNTLCCAGFLYGLIYAFGSITESVWTQNPSFILLISLLINYSTKIKKYGNVQ